ncbi:MAG: Nucleic acid binding protein [Methanomicrobiales archaeon 53_19]|jgi:UPF0271 protein|uniref:NOB1 family endonuclease n=1 Tax=Methanocalculus sp. TaxID=2004547 RepID=UPI000747DA44|nr:nucleotide-binding protein [Methanocalculus sp.]KUK69569.1 MAG: Nucleic acid binding protein [Methanocalculus sp. 52_23]KUL03866.1 MAG: Nucleic acid binding protein [Methanomicrobiales archaeon 53_19]HIJ06588.1 nucleotide-binding protein [Methanocalculus sp.]
MKIVCDASFFFGDYPFEGDLFTTPGVVAELCDLRSKCRFDTLKECGLTVTEPSSASIRMIRQTAGKTGDHDVLSETDISILALASEIGGEVATDDFAVQNVASALGIRVRPMLQRKAKRRTWKMICTGCGRDVENGADCPVCGAPLKRMHK